MHYLNMFIMKWEERKMDKSLTGCSIQWHSGKFGLVNHTVLTPTPAVRISAATGTKVPSYILGNTQEEGEDHDQVGEDHDHGLRGVSRV